MEKEDQPERIQFIIIPDFIMADKTITASEKLFLCDIISLSQQKGYCWKQNKNLAERHGVKTDTITDWITDLENKKYITRLLLYQDDSKKVCERRLFICF